MTSGKEKKNVELERRKRGRERERKRAGEGERKRENEEKKTIISSNMKLSASVFFSRDYGDFVEKVKISYATCATCYNKRIF